MVAAVRDVEKALGEVKYELTEKNVKAGKVFTEKNISSIWSGYGLPPKFLKAVVGCQASQNISKGTSLGWSQISG